MSCSVAHCRSRPNKEEGVKFYAIPKVRRFKYALTLNDLSSKRRKAWLDLLDPENTWSEAKLKYSTVCSKHFYFGRPANLEDTTHCDWVPSQNLDGEIVRKKAGKRDVDKKLPLRSRNNCTMCYEHISRKDSLKICETDGSFTQFGCILHHILKMSGCPFRSRFCCQNCSRVVMDCFDTVRSINIQSLMSIFRTTNCDVADILDKGCIQCGHVCPTVEEYSSHITNHVFQSYKGRFVTLDRRSDMLDLEETREKKRSKTQMKMKNDDGGSDTESAESDGEIVEGGDSSKVLKAVKSRQGGKRPVHKRKNIEPEVKRKRGRPKTGKNVPAVSSATRVKSNADEIMSDNEINLSGTEEDNFEMMLQEKLEYPCKLCDFEFSHQSILAEHVTEKHNRFPCGRCTSIFENKEFLVAHEKENHSKTIGRSLLDDDLGFQCELCIFNFSNEKILANHMKAFHPPEKEVSWAEHYQKQPKILSRVVNRPENSSSANNELLTEYLESEVVDNILKGLLNDGNADSVVCKTCDFRLPNEELLSYHMKSAHKSSEIPFEVEFLESD